MHYDSRRLVTLARGHDRFRLSLPYDVRRIAGIAPLTDGAMPQAKARELSNQMIEAAKKLVEEGATTLLEVLYNYYALSVGLVSTTPYADPTIRVPKPFTSLTLGEVAAWEKYLETCEVPREVAIDALARLVSILVDVPNITGITDLSFHELKLQLERSKRRIVLDTLPDLTDQEARLLFGSASTAEHVRAFARIGA